MGYRSRVVRHFAMALLVQACLYFAVYFVRCFIFWEIVNPFFWILQLPHYTVDTRVWIFLGFISVQVPVHGMVWAYLSEKESAKNNTQLAATARN